MALDIYGRLKRGDNVVVIREHTADGSRQEFSGRLMQFLPDTGESDASVKIADDGVLIQIWEYSSRCVGKEWRIIAIEKR